MVPDTTSRSSLSAVDTVAPEADASAGRWREWQQRNAAGSRTAARRARITFTLIFAGLGAWVGVQLINSPLWP